MLTILLICYVFVTVGIIAGAVTWIVRREREFEEAARALRGDTGSEAAPEDPGTSFNALTNTDETADGPVLLSTRTA